MKNLMHTTQLNAIIVPKKETKLLWIKPRKEEVIGHMCELSHILETIHNRRLLCKIVGFEEVEKFRLPKD